MLRAAGEVLAGDDRLAFRTFATVLDAQASRTRFDRGDFIPLDAASIALVRRRIAEGEADPKGGAAFYYALHRIFHFEMPNRYSRSKAPSPSIGGSSSSASASQCSLMRMALRLRNG